VDILPNKPYRYTGERWIEINKDNSKLYLDNDDYIKYLVNELDNRRIDIDDLTDEEQEEVARYRSKT
jgi:hypothetical protein